eukprot:6203391-Pleurochrysis_carterae.AAC.1
MAAEESVVRQRLLAKEAPLRSLSKKFLAFATAIESGTLEKCEEIQQELLKELAAYEFGMQKARCLIDTNRQQVDEYGEMHRGIEKEMCANVQPCLLVKFLRYHSSLPCPNAKHDGKCRQLHIHSAMF